MTACLNEVQLLRELQRVDARYWRDLAESLNEVQLLRELQRRELMSAHGRESSLNEVQLLRELQPEEGKELRMSGVMPQ